MEQPGIPVAMYYSVNNYSLQLIDRSRSEEDIGA
jgi:hypothetical protein